MEMKALSIRQPWGWLVCKGYKDIENREWKLPAWGFFPPQRIYVHVGKTMDVNVPALSVTEGWILERLTQEQRDEYHTTPIHRGAIIGKVDIIDCVEKHPSPWFVGRYGFVLANPFLYARPIPCKGKLGFFVPDLACNESNPCCDRRDEYNGFASGPLKFVCPKSCSCHD